MVYLLYNWITHFISWSIPLLPNKSCYTRINSCIIFSYFKMNFWRLKRHFWGLCRSYDPPTCGVYLGGSKKQNNFLKIFFKLENGILIFFWNPLYFQKIQRISKKLKTQFSNLKKIFRKLFCFLDPPKYTPYVGGSKERHNPQKWLLSLQNLILKYENISFVFFEENQWKSKCQYPGHEINFLSKMWLLTLITMILRKTKNTPHQIEMDFLKWWHALLSQPTGACAELGKNKPRTI